MEWTSKDKKKANLDNVAKDILYKTLDNNIAEADPSTSQPTRALAATIPEQSPCSTSSRSAEEMIKDAMASFIRKFGKFMRKHNTKPSSFDSPKRNFTTPSDDKFYNFGRPGHFMADYRKPRRDEKKAEITRTKRRKWFIIKGERKKPWWLKKTKAPGSDQFHEETGTSNGIHLAVGPQPLRLRNHNFGLAHRIMVKRLETSPHDPLGITDSACKNQLVVVSVQYGPFNTYILIRSTTIGKSRVARDQIAMHTSWRSNSDITSVTRASMTFRVVRTNQYNQDLGLIHSTNGNHLESPNEGSSIDHQVTIHLHAQNITMFPTNETWYFTSHILFSSSGGLILILMAQSTRNEFRMHSTAGWSSCYSGSTVFTVLPVSLSAQQQQQPQVAQQSGHQRFRPRGQQFKNKLGSGSSGSGSSSSSGSRTEFCGFCGGKHPSTQCVGVQGSCNLCGQYGHFARVCPSSGSQQTAAQPQGRGGPSRGRSQQFQQPRLGETQFRPFQQPGPSRFGQSSQPFFSGPQHAQVNAITREQAEETPSQIKNNNTKTPAFDKHTCPQSVIYD
ncbi:hypothetical protein F511_42678 [Dorcoceras hygrometricum]|uniref:CCHC-type domain-containing protein n=1 Tax=Dorcoceras hygrometricum TaxID=472368 RepID=A0A2Z6ZZC9_9LAMI|nr:hypothetical protein F511_42678 [Dorcoceras hygrometricum]